MTAKDKTVQLQFTPEAKELLTPFRKRALEMLYEIGCKELGLALESAAVAAHYDYSEPVPPILMLTLTADVDRHEWSRSHKAITHAEVKQAASWTDAERADSAKMVYFQLVPLRL